MMMKVELTEGTVVSYNRVNGLHASEDPGLIGQKGILRKEWGFKGLIMSDW